MKKPTSKLGLPAKLQPAPSWCSPSFWPLDRLCSLSHGEILCSPWTSLYTLVCHYIVQSRGCHIPLKLLQLFSTCLLYTPHDEVLAVCFGESCPPTCPERLPVRGHKHKDSPGDSYQPGEPHHPPFSFEPPTLVKCGELSQLSTVEIEAWSQLLLKKLLKLGASFFKKKKSQPPVYIKAHAEKFLHPCPAAPPPTLLKIQQLET